MRYISDAKNLVQAASKEMFSFRAIMAAIFSILKVMCVVGKNKNVLARLSPTFIIFMN
jgi:hypothetical protein